MTEVAKGFLEGKKVIFDVSKLETDIAKTSFNFLSGVAYSLEGNLEKVASDVFAITPAFKCLFLDGFEDEIINEELDKVRDYKADFSEENIIALHNLYEKLYNEKASVNDRFAVKYGTFLIDVGQKEKGLEVLNKYILGYEGEDDDLFKTVAKVVIAFSMKKELK
ncbi:MAG: cell division protein SepF [Firmicutes bacterium]|nr:cell division protein SepF [Bacillota bacterium]